MSECVYVFVEVVKICMYSSTSNVSKYYFKSLITMATFSLIPKGMNP